MADSVIVRELRDGDVEAIAAIAVAAWEPIFASFRRLLGEELFAAQWPDWRAEKARQVRDCCDPARGAVVCVAECAGRVVGFATAGLDARRRIGEIGNNAVDPAWRGRGVAGRMYEYLFDRLRHRGMETVKVTTGLDDSHAAARRAYAKAGFAAALPSVTYYRIL